MKNYLRILENSKRHSLHKVIPLRDQPDELSEWQALQIIEDSAENMRHRLQQILPEHLEQNVCQVRLELQQKPISAKLFLKAQFYEMGKKDMLLKVFVYQQTNKGKALKLARAVYHLDISQQQREIA